jgi:hypothetical protein
MTAQAVETVVAQLADAGLNLSLAPAGGLAVAPSSHLTADLRALIRSSKALLIDWLTAANDAASHAPDPPDNPWTGKNWQRPTTPTTSTARPASPPGVAPLRTTLRRWHGAVAGVAKRARCQAKAA